MVFCGRKQLGKHLIYIRAFLENSENKKMDYSDYWNNENWQKRENRKYYSKLYGRIKKYIKVPYNAKMLDIGGGDGHLMHYLGLYNAEIMDISDSGLDVANKMGFKTVKADIEKEFPLPNSAYDSAFCFEVLEHLRLPDVTLSEIHRVLKPSGILYIGQPNMRADGYYHLRRYYLEDIRSALIKAGFCIGWVDYIPAFTMSDAILDDICKTKSLFRKIKQSVALILSFLPWHIRYIMARVIPNRFALLFIIKAMKK